jgi:hypothetical protein
MKIIQGEVFRKRRDSAKRARRQGVMKGNAPRVRASNAKSQCVRAADRLESPSRGRRVIDRFEAAAAHVDGAGRNVKDFCRFEWFMSAAQAVGDAMAANADCHASTARWP